MVIFNALNIWFIVLIVVFFLAFLITNLLQYRYPSVHAPIRQELINAAVVQPFTYEEMLHIVNMLTYINYELRKHPLLRFARFRYTSKMRNTNERIVLQLFDRIGLFEAQYLNKGEQSL